MPENDLRTRNKIFTHDNVFWEKRKMCHGKKIFLHPQKVLEKLNGVKTLPKFVLEKTFHCPHLNNIHPSTHQSDAYNRYVITIILVYPRITFSNQIKPTYAHFVLFTLQYIFHQIDISQIEFAGFVIVETTIQHFTV